MHAHNQDLPVAVIGAGPVGLAAAAHLVEAGLQPLVLEAGDSVAANLETYRHVRLFSPWAYNLDRAALALLERAGWQAPAPAALPTAGELVDLYLARLAGLPALAGRIKLGHRVLQITRQGFDKVKTSGREAAPFVLRAATPDGVREVRARAVIDATGTWSQPNPLGAHGLAAQGEAELAGRISHGMPDILGADRARFAGKRVLVAGAGHSAAGSLLALAALADAYPSTAIIWAIRGEHMLKIFGGGSADGLPARGELGQRLKALQEAGRLELRRNFRIASLAAVGGAIRLTGEPVRGELPVIDGVDEIIASTGARPDLALTRELRVRHDPWLESTDALAPLIDPNLHHCGSIRPHGHRELAHPESGYYAVGAKSYGRAPNFLMVTGYEQVRSVVAALKGDIAAADDVRLALPETGVCGTDPRFAQTGAGGCCGGSAPAGVDACCVLDASEKARGKAGCGCNA